MKRVLFALLMSALIAAGTVAVSPATPASAAPLTKVSQKTSGNWTYTVTWQYYYEGMTHTKWVPTRISIDSNNGCLANHMIANFLYLSPGVIVQQLNASFPPTTTHTRYFTTGSYKWHDQDPRVNFQLSTTCGSTSVNVRITD
jgi:hypothetical protein